ncbi:MAG: hypothetical protein AAGH64_01200 [Planctomycetota bacterium]
MSGAPIERFLGSIDPGAGPAELLGVDADRASPADLREALAARLRRVDAHPQARGAEADEVRLALHVAAAQLADAIDSRGVDRPGQAERPRRAITPGVVGDPRTRTLMAVLAHSGGWNPAARHRLAAVSHAMGLTLEQAIALLVEPAEASGAPPAPAARGRVREAEASTRPPRLGATPIGRLLLGGAALCAVASLVLAGTIVWLLTRGSDDAPPIDMGTPQAPSTGAVVPSAGAVATPAGAVVLDTDSIVRAFALAENDVGAFRAAYGFARTGWSELEPGALERIAFACAQAVADATDARQAMVSVIAADLDVGIAAPAQLFAAGVAARAEAFGVMRVPERIAEARPRGSQEIGPILAGAGGALVALASVADTDVTAWGGAASALQAQSVPGGRAALTEALERLLRGGGDPDVRESELLIAATRSRLWDASDDEMLTSWWDDQSIAVSRLSLVANELVAGGVLGLDRSVALAADATPDARRGSARALARALGGPTASEQDDAFAVAWVEALRADAGSTATLDDGLAIRVARIARLNASAAMWWAGDTEGARAALASVGSFGRAAPTDPIDIESFTSATRPPDGEWAARYLSVRGNEEERLALLTTLRGGGVLHGPADADVLARAALLGSSRSVRASAQSVVRLFADEPMMLNGLLEGVHSAAPQPDVSDMLAFVSGSRLPPVDDRAWRASVRRALSERFMTMMLRAAGGGVGVAEDATRLAYRTRIDPGAGLSGDADEPRPIDDPLLRTLSERSRVVMTRDVAGLCDELWGVWHASASRIPEGAWAPRSMSSIERRRAARGAYGTGGLQRFALAQLSLVEVMGYLIASERPDRSGEIAGVIYACERGWREAGRVLEQTVIAERAMARLWAIRMGLALDEAGGA